MEEDERVIVRGEDGEEEKLNEGDEGEEETVIGKRGEGGAQAIIFSKLYGIGECPACNSLLPFSDIVSSASGCCSACPSSTTPVNSSCSESGEF